MMMAKFVGYILDVTGSYTLIFVVAGSVYVVALACVHLLAPGLDRVRVE